MGEHVCRFDADTAKLREQSDRRVGALFRLLLQSFQTRRLDLLNLPSDQLQACHLAIRSGNTRMVCGSQIAISGSAVARSF